MDQKKPRNVSPRTLENRAYARLTNARAALAKAEGSKVDAVAKADERIAEATKDVADAQAAYDAAKVA